MNTCFTPDELRELTGFRQKSKVLAACHANDIPVISVGADGWPRVMRDFNAPGGRGASRSLTKSELNLSALKEIQSGSRKNKA